MPQITRLLIANRGEIACRIIRTAREMGISTVAVYSDADEGALHVRMADQGVNVGPAPAGESYLDTGKIIQAALRTGADAVHPGYGFLSENANFAQKVAEAGLIFVGPPPDAISVMGSKSRSKALMKKAGVPLVPGYHGRNQNIETLAKAADEAGYPVLVKASAGGGGKGMRVVSEPAELADAVAGAKREAKAAFGDDRMMIEKYLPSARHIEIQVFGDTKGNYVHLFERDCSLQRRHQKVIEEAPSPGMTEDKRAEMGRSAIDAARAVDYTGAGTVEFLVAGDDHYFIEMNTRLQVEHPVTESITGLDLVEWQLRVAAGEALPLSQEEITLTGHAFEARIYAEDADKGFLPQTGHLAHVSYPTGSNIRIDAGVASGSDVSVHYDPMIAKIIVHDRDRKTALDTLTQALSATRIVGVETNVDFLSGVSAHKAFRKGGVDTGWLDRLKPPKGGWSKSAEPTRDMLIGVAMRVMEGRSSWSKNSASNSADPYSPWRRTDGWRLNDIGFQEIRLQAEEQEFVVKISGPVNNRYLAEIDGESISVMVGQDAAAVIDGLRAGIEVLETGSGTYATFADGRRSLVSVVQAAFDDGEEQASSGGLGAPMPGKITAVHVRPGDSVSRGQALLILEAMKMEHTIAAPADGEVKEVRYDAGDQVEEGTSLLIFEATG